MVWTLAAGASLVWNLLQHAEEVRSLTLLTARALLEKDLLYRNWGTLHGGVYVPVTDQTQPNPYLKVPERDIVTPSGKALTLMNPAYMTRQVIELQDRQMGIRGHITSLKPLRPENRADAWEEEALATFEKGNPEFSSVETIDGKPYFRLMRPLPVVEGCLGCHAEQGYKVGDVRGGISVNIPLNRFAAPRHVTHLALAHAGLWVLGMAGLLLGWQNLQRHHRERQRAQAEREGLIGELQAALINVKTLSGLVPICAYCKKIRDDKGYWNQLEGYIQSRTEAHFSHGLCPECIEKMYPELAAQVNAPKNRSGASPKPAPDKPSS